MCATPVAFERLGSLCVWAGASEVTLSSLAEPSASYVKCGACVLTVSLRGPARLWRRVARTVANEVAAEHCWHMLFVALMDLVAVLWWYPGAASSRRVEHRKLNERTPPLIVRAFLPNYTETEQNCLDGRRDTRTAR